MARSLWSLRRLEYNVTTLLINHTDVSIKRMQAVEEENEARREEVSRLIEQVDDIMVRNVSKYPLGATNV